MIAKDLLRTDLGPFLAPARAAVVGLSERNEVARDLARGLADGGCEAVGVHPRNREVDGWRCVPRLGDVDEPVDLVCVAVGAGTIVAAVEDALDAGARHFLIPGLGPESGAEGAAARARLAQLLDAADAALVGPNCMGVCVPGGPSPWIGSVLPTIRPGGVATCVQSGSIGEALMAMGPRVGLRAVVSSGNEIVRDAADWLAFFAADERTRAIGLFLEAVRRPAAFEQALAAAAEAQKAVVVLKVGRSAVAAARAVAHTGAIVGSDRAFAALCEAYGVLRVADYGDFVEHLELLGTPRRPRGRRTVVITNSGGEGELLADLADAAGLPLAELPPDLAADLDAAWPFHGVGNPVDYWAVAEQERILPASTLACARHPAIDVVVVNIDQSLRFTNGEYDTGIAAADAAALAVRETDTFVAVVSTATADAHEDVVQRCAKAGVPLLIGGDRAFRAIAAARRLAPRTRLVPAASPAVALDLPARAGALPERESKELLAAYGVAGTRERRAPDPDEAVAAAAALGYPVVVKSDGPAHKELHGGVALGLATPAAVRAAAQRLGPVLVAEELRGGVEVLCGVVRDAGCGPLVVCGVGGSWAEALADSTRAALAPIAEAEAAALVRRVRPLAHRLDEPGVAAVAAVLVALGRMAGDHPRIAEIDVNPLRVHRGGAVALDALVVLSEESP